MLNISGEIDIRLQALTESYKELLRLQQSLSTFDKDDYRKDSEKGRLLTSTLGSMEAVEIKILSGLAALVTEFECLLKKQGIALNLLDPVKLFHPHILIEQVLRGQSEPPKSFSEISSKTYNMLIQRSEHDETSGASGGLTAVRHLVQFDDNFYDVVELIQSLVQMWSLVLESNLKLSDHVFLNINKYIAAEMWTSGDFYRMASMHFTASLIKNNQSQHITDEITIIKREIQDRLDRIAFHFVERHQSKVAIRNICGSDSLQKTEEYRKSILEIQITEENLLHELFHLGDNIKKYLKQYNRSNDFKIFEQFQPYRWCGKYVNSLKHGLIGKNKSRATCSYIAELYDQEGPKPVENDKLFDFVFILNIDGFLVPGITVASRLIDIWLLFLRYHSDIDLADVTAKINGIRNKTVGRQSYSFDIPDGLTIEAQKEAQKLRQLNI